MTRLTKSSRRKHSEGGASKPPITINGRGAISDFGCCNGNYHPKSHYKSSMRSDHASDVTAHDTDSKRNKQQLWLQIQTKSTPKSLRNHGNHSGVKSKLKTGKFCITVADHSFMSQSCSCDAIKNQKHTSRKQTSRIQIIRASRESKHPEANIKHQNQRL